MYYLYTCTGVQVPLRARATASNTRTSIQMLWAAPMPQQLPKPPQQQQQWRWQQQVGAEVAWETCVRFGGWWLRWWRRLPRPLQHRRFTRWRAPWTLPAPVPQWGHIEFLHTHCCQSSLDVFTNVGQAAELIVPQRVMDKACSCFWSG